MVHYDLPKAVTDSMTAVLASGYVNIGFHHLLLLWATSQWK
jgi:hypothetical protein